jgi:ribosomal-protein-alanine N-acetyltransferase
VGLVDRWQVTPLTAAHARELTSWRYPPPYDRYELGHDPDALTDPAAGFVSLVDAHGRLVGFRSFGHDGRVPGGDYDDTALDTGGGLRPDLTGRGLGRAAIALGLAFGRATFAPPAFRVTVWGENSRALAVVRSLGFVDVARFRSTTTGEDYAQLVRPEA